MRPLDIHTAVLLLIISTMLMALTLAAGRTASGRGLAKWNWGLGSIALAWLLIAGRATLPPLYGMALADGLMLAGLCLQITAMIELDGGRAPRWLLLAPGPALFIASAPLLEDYAAFNLVVSASFALALFALAACCAGARGTGARPARWMMAAFYVAGGLALAARAGVFWMRPESHPDVFAPGLLQSVTFILLFALTLTGSFGFLVLQRAQAETEIRRLAMMDPLTELLNRRAFMDLAERELARARRSSLPYAILMMDLDHFKGVNDEHGHQAGDRVLADFAALVRRSLRTEDLAGRYGGEEFCAMLPGATLATALAIGERIRAAAAAQPLGGLSQQVITVSIGVMACDPGSMPGDLDGAIARADAALYRAKRDGRNRVTAEPPERRPPPSIPSGRTPAPRASVDPCPSRTGAASTD